MFYKKEHFNLLLKDLIKHLNNVYILDINEYLKIDILNKNNTFLIERPYNINNQIFPISFYKKNKEPLLDIVIIFDNNRKLIFNFYKDLKNIEIYLSYNGNKVNIQKYALPSEIEYDLSLEPIFSKYINIFLGKYILFDNLQSF